MRASLRQEPLRPRLEIEADGHHLCALRLRAENETASETILHRHRADGRHRSAVVPAVQHQSCRSCDDDKGERQHRHRQRERSMTDVLHQCVPEHGKERPAGAEHNECGEGVSPGAPLTLGGA